MKINESQLNKIINESVKNVLKESFNDNEISQAIAEHGGLNQRNRRWGASFFSDFDLQNANFSGYLSPNTIRELENTFLAFHLKKWLLYTNDGGAIVVEMGRNDFHDTKWNEKVKKRNQQWGEDGSDKKEFTDILGNKRERYIKPIEINTVDRRRERKM